MNIVITGASSGIGRALSIQLSQAHKVLALSRNIEKLEQLHLENKTNISIQQFDITDFDPEKLKNAITAFGGADILINNAGILINKAFTELSTKEWRAIFEVNVFGVAHLTQTLIPFLENSSIAHIVNIGSMGGFQGSSKFSGLSAYSSSKAALANLTECLAEELKESNIKCNCLCLGAVNTEMLAHAFPGYDAPVNSHEMAAYIADFSLNAYKYINGKVIPVALNNP